jgi:type VI secretion system protein ImpF
MARSQADVVVTLPVLDRLVDREPDLTVEAPLSRAQSIRTLKAAVRRDLEFLLNTRRIADPPDESLKEVNRSVYVYGLPDFSTVTIGSPNDQSWLIRQLLTTIKTFEPRLGNVRITPLEHVEVGLKQLRLRIEGMLLMDPAPEPMAFDTVIELKSGACRVSGGENAG